MTKPAKAGYESITLACLLLAVLAGCRSEGGTPGSSTVRPRAGAVVDNSFIIVNSLADMEVPPDGVVTLRSALALLDDGGTIAFSPSLDNGTIDLSIVGEPHSTLKGEQFTMVPGVGWQFDGFLDRDYGASALYARKSVTIDASSLRSGITLRWIGGDANRARVLAVYGDLVLRNITIRGGFSSAVAIGTDPAQPFTLARGGAVANWGSGVYEDCTFGENRVLGDSTGSRDRGAFGGAIYGDGITMDNCVVSGNRAEGYGAAGGGIYSLGGRENGGSGWGSEISNCALTGNRVTGQHAYGGGIYTDGGGIGNMFALKLTNCTIARNLVEDNPGIPENVRSQYYYRGGGVYMSNGWVEIASCTVAENEVSGVPYPFSGKPNMGGGGIAATIGNAHDVEDMGIWHSVLVGNKVNGEGEDIFTGSLVHFFSVGYNRVGRIDFSQMLVPIPAWECLNRNHWPKIGDAHGIALDDALIVRDAKRHDWIRSAGTDNGHLSVLWYPPSDPLLDQIPPYSYSQDYVFADYYSYTDNIVPLVNAVLARLRDRLGSGFGSTLPDSSSLRFYVEPVIWPSMPENEPWIAYWRAVDNEIGGRMGPEKLGEDFWGTFREGTLGEDGYLSVYSTTGYYAPTRLADFDQRGVSRPTGGRGDIGAVERTADEEPSANPPPGESKGGGCSVAPGGGEGGISQSMLPLLLAVMFRKAVRRIRHRG
jgi:hypothetical protein